MATAIQFVSAALEKIRVKDPGEDIDATDLATGIEELNDMLLEWHERGIWLGYTVISSGTDAVTLPDWTHRAVKAKLAVTLAERYGKEVTNALFDQADTGYRLIRDKATAIRPYAKPSTMPRGMGNTQGFGGHGQPDYYANIWDTEIGSGTGRALADERNLALRKDEEEPSS
jgi:hypothetical protein